MKKLILIAIQFINFPQLVKPNLSPQSVHAQRNPAEPQKAQPLADMIKWILPLVPHSLKTNGGQCSQPNPRLVYKLLRKHSFCFLS
ncbi:hypothetical protein CEXT_168601 [Caerostris extrusa]|uniref:Uncharacterized protein n=1 Tax=Caerostris extrusa TaxID=172846 RepID=A0AAV4UAC9_CAEEX|nr:hypothetical protein CEXT_168601 [Caerostris extrusa]